MKRTLRDIIKEEVSLFEASKSQMSDKVASAVQKIVNPRELKRAAGEGNTRVIRKAIDDLGRIKKALDKSGQNSSAVDKILASVQKQYLKAKDISQYK